MTLGLSAWVGCRPLPPPVRTAPFPAELAPYLVDPGEGSEAACAAEVSAEWSAFAASGRAAPAAARATELAGQPGGCPPALALLAETELLARQSSAAEATLRAAAAAAGEPALQLVYARAAELAGDPVAALAAFERAASRYPLAAARRGDVRPAALDELSRRFDAELRRQRIPDAEAALSLLETWAPGEERTIEAERALAAAKGDGAREIEAVRRLVAAHPERTDLQLRRAALEMEFGDPRAGLDLFAGLVARFPRDPAIADQQAQAKFLFRLQNAPDGVKRARLKNQLTRADFAVLLYWLVPQVRTARAGAAHIASDILDHPARDEIVRVVNLGLLQVDESLHLFDPNRPLRRSEALAALLRLLADDERAAGCVGDLAGALASRDAICAAASACALTAGEAPCPPGGGLSGGEATELLRRTLDRLGVP